MSTALLGQWPLLIPSKTECRLTCLDNAWTWDKWSWWFYSLLVPYSQRVQLKSHRPARNINVWKTTSSCRHGTCGKTWASFPECPLCFLEQEVTSWKHCIYSFYWRHWIFYKTCKRKNILLDVNIRLYHHWDSNSSKNESIINLRQDLRVKVQYVISTLHLACNLYLFECEKI